MLDPYTVLDFTDERGELGPMLLGDLGAEVIRIELPGGTSARRSGPGIVKDNAENDSPQFLAFNRNKKSIVLDPNDPKDCLALNELIKRADFVFESGTNAKAYGVDFETARKLQARVIWVQITTFGVDGPHADLVGNDLVIAAMGGPVALQGPLERAPVRVTVPQVWRHVGAESAAAALAAHARMVKTGVGKYVDLSAQTVMTWTMLQAMDAHAIQGFDFQRKGSQMPNPVGIELVHPCADGYVVALPMSKVIKGCMPWMIEDGIFDSSAQELDWDEFDHNVANPAYEPFNYETAKQRLREFFKKHTKEELLQYGIKHNVTLAPVNTLPELMQLEHLQTRDYWDWKEVGGQKVRTAGLWAKTNVPALSIRQEAPKLNEHSDEVRQRLTEPFAPHDYPPTEGPEVLPFRDVKVADFSWVGVGPISSKYLADHGATVVRIESENRPDVLRGGAPFKDAEPGWNRSQFFGDFNTSKMGMALDLKLPEARDLAKKIIQWSDVVIESFAPGAFERMGFSYEEIQKINPNVIMVSTCLMGQTGPAARLAGYGYHAAAMAGFYEVTGWKDLGPSGPWTAYTDTIAPRFVSTILAAALDQKRRSGKGVFIDLAQIEAALHFLAPEFLDYQINGYSPTRLGNRSRETAPQGCYACEGDDRWCAIAIDTEDQWLQLVEMIPQLDAEQDNMTRQLNHDAIDQTISDWTTTRDARAVMMECQSRGIPAGLVQRSSDLLADPQYVHRKFYRYFDHPEMGNVPYAGHQYRISDYDNGPRGPAPLLGEHSFEVLTELLGLNEDELSAAFSSGAIT